MNLCFIPDGYTENGVVASVANLHPRLAFTYRPMLAEQRFAYLQQAEKLSPIQLRRLACRLLERQLLTWDVQDQKGDTVAITEANLMRLKEKPFDRLFLIVNGLAPSEETPERTDEDASASLDDALAAAEQGVTASAAREARDRKN